jgi:transcriptional regulator with XRE-family HTH domain
VPKRPLASAHQRNCLGSWLRETREAKGLSQADVAEKCQLAGWDIDRLAIHRIETHQRQLLDFELLMLLQVLGKEPILKVPKNLKAFFPDPK